jgi:hypothetical protein
MVPRPYRPEPRITLIDILGARRAVFHIDQPGFAVTLPGDRRRGLDFFEAGRAPVAISSISLDGGYTIELSLVP